VIVQNKPNGKGMGRLFRAFSCSIKGFRAAFRYEDAFRQETLLCGVLFPLSFVIASDLQGWLFLNATLALLLVVELINSAIEALADRITQEHDELIGRAKDMGSAAVLLATAVLVGTWGLLGYEAALPFVR
jgi:diacylglycerol kinase (ATP)